MKYLKNIERMKFRRPELPCLWFILCIVSLHTAESQTHFIFAGNTGVNATIAVPLSAAPNISGVPIAAGDEIGVFTPAGLCVGAIVWNGDNAVVTCWGDNDQTAEADGITDGEQIRYRLWQRSSDYEFKSINVTYSEGGGTYYANGIYILSSFSVEGTVTIDAECLAPACIPDSIAAMASFSFCRIIGSPMIETIRIFRSGTACDADVPKARLYRDMNRNNIIDAGDIQLDSSHCFSGGNTCFDGLNYSPDSSENLLIVFEISPDAEPSNTTSAVLDSNDVSGSSGTDVIFHGVSTPVYPLHLGIIGFSAVVKGYTVTLLWENSSEANTHGFVVQRTNLGTDKREAQPSFLWSELAFIERNYTLSGFRQYSYVDERLAAGRYGYRLKHLDRDGTFFYSELIEAEILPPNRFTLEQNYPNPFNPSTTIRYSIPQNPRGLKDLDGLYVTLKIYDLLGREIASLVNEEQSAGWKEVRWNASAFSSGIYFYKLTAGNYVGVKKLMVLK